MNEPALKALGNALACGRDLVIQTCQVGSGRITARLNWHVHATLYGTSVQQSAEANKVQHAGYAVAQRVIRHTCQHHVSWHGVALGRREKMT